MKPPPQHVSAQSACTLTIDLDALVRNWRAANEASGAATASAVVKADAYGLGVEPVAKALADAGCDSFFVALPEEGALVRAVAPDARIFVLNGPTPGCGETMVKCQLIPAINDLTQARHWATVCAEAGARLPAALHLDTGMNRLGFGMAELEHLRNDTTLLRNFETVLVMSHLACADIPDNEMSAMQRRNFDSLRVHLPDAPASLANSAGIFLGSDYHYELTRPGICLYGASPFADAPAPFEPVITATARILQVRDIAAGETVGYGATFTAQRNMRLATIAAGYADGLFRSAAGRAFAVVNGVAVPYVGRVSMDLVVLDVSAPGARDVEAGDAAELIGPSISVDTLANAAGTIGYEVLTSLGRRYTRRYIYESATQKT